MKKLAIFIIIASLYSVMPVFADQNLVKELIFQRSADALRLVFGQTKPVEPNVFYLHNPERMIVDLPDTKLMGKLPNIPTGESFIQNIRSGSPEGTSLRVVLDFTRPIEARDHWLTSDQKFGHKLILDMKSYGYTARKSNTIASIKPSTKFTVSKPIVKSSKLSLSTSRASTTIKPKTAQLMVNNFKLPTIKSDIWDQFPSKNGRKLIVVVDPGHGGKDSGAVGPGGTYEKDVVLSIGRRLTNLINATVGMKAVMTRSTDVFIPLRQRVRKAQAAHGDLFISIHADAAYNSNAQGASVFTLSDRGASSAEARALADKENAVDLIDDEVENKNDLLVSVLVRMTMAATMESSAKAANNVLRNLYQVGEIHKESVQYAGFAVLKAPDIPSMLVETAYISNPEEEMLLRSGSYQDQLATAIFNGVKEYFQTSSPVSTRLAKVVKQSRIAE
jgi:N-acetylmuramoyl-L-alanine amidase